MMCFDNGNCDWYAAIQNVTDGTGKTSRCYECGNAIADGEWRRSVFQQEHEECQRCEWEELEDDDEPCVDHDYGETFSCDICEPCLKLLKAIEAVEADEGCPDYARQPMFGDLHEAMDYDDSGRYSRRALSMFPELAGHRFLPLAETQKPGGGSP